MTAGFLLCPHPEKPGAARHSRQAEGRLTQRSEYSAVIQRNNGQVSALLAAMRNQIQQLAAREGR